MKQYTVTGMTCAACSARVESAVKKVDGVTACSVSLLTNAMTLDGSFQEEEVFSAVKKAGYGILSSLGNPTEKTKKEAEEKENGLLLSLISSLVILLFLMYVSMGHMLSLPLPSWFNPMSQGIYQFILSSLVLLIHRRFFIKGFSGLIHAAPNMDTLVALGSGVSYLYSVILLFLMTARDLSGQKELLHGLFFESAAMILVLITVGKMLEAHSKGKTTSAIRALQKLSPDTAHLLVDGREEEVSLSAVKVGDMVVVRPGESFPVDGSVIEGEGAVEESALTGESLPVDKAVGDMVYTGTMNLSGKLICRAEKVGSDTALSRIIERVAAASAGKAPVARMADRVSAVFVPVIMALALITFTTWLILGETIGKALSYGIGVLVVSCPCALGLATPVAIMVANGVAARHGVLFKTAAALEEAGKTKIVLLDKTGTITTGNMQVQEVICAEGVLEEEFLSLAAGLEEGSSHPLAKAVVSHVHEKGIGIKPIEEFQSLSGFGVRGLFEGEIVLGGKKELLSSACTIPESVLARGESFAGEGKTPLFFAKGETFLGMITCSDAVKPDSRDAITRLSRMGIRTGMITGDRQEVARTVGNEVGIYEIKAGVLPEEKEECVRALRKEGKVLMVGDGINDAPALTAAHLGVAIGAGVEVAMDAAEVVLMNSSLSDLPNLILLSRKTLRNIKQNLFWAFCYNIIGIPLAAGVFEPLFGWSLSPMFGAAAMSLSSFLVVSNALRLNFFSWGARKQKHWNVKEKKMEKILKIQGMMCPHCEAHVKKALEAIPGVEEAIPSHEKGEAIVRLSADVSDALLKEAVEKEGYQVL